MNHVSQMPPFLYLLSCILYSSDIWCESCSQMPPFCLLFIILYSVYCIVVIYGVIESCAIHQCFPVYLLYKSQLEDVLQLMRFKHLAGGNKLSDKIINFINTFLINY